MPNPGLSEVGRTRQGAAPGICIVLHSFSFHHPLASTLMSQIGMEADTADDEESWLQELLQFHSHRSLAPQLAEPSSDDDEWMHELLFAHHRTSPSTSTILEGVGSATRTMLAHPHGSSLLANPHGSPTGACSSAPRNPDGSARATGACSSTPRNQNRHHAHWDFSMPVITKVEARAALIAEAQSIGALPSVCVPQKDCVLWNVQSVLDPVTWGKQRLSAWLFVLGPAIFKVGIAASPMHRFFSSEFGYVLEERWHFMDVIWKGPANRCRQIEIDLIAATQCVEGSFNEKLGGDGVHPDRTHECYVYLVLAAAGHGLSLKRARMLRSEHVCVP